MSWVGRDVLRRSCCDASAGADADADADADASNAVAAYSNNTTTTNNNNNDNMVHSVVYKGKIRHFSLVKDPDVVVTSSELEDLLRAAFALDESAKIVGFSATKRGEEGIVFVTLSAVANNKVDENSISCFELLVIDRTETRKEGLLLQDSPARYFSEETGSHELTVRSYDDDDLLTVGTGTFMSHDGDNPYSPNRHSHASGATLYSPTTMNADRAGDADSDIHSMMSVSDFSDCIAVLTEEGELDWLRGQILMDYIWGNFNGEVTGPLRTAYRIAEYAQNVQILTDALKVLSEKIVEDAEKDGSNDTSSGAHLTISSMEFLLDISESVIVESQHQLSARTTSTVDVPLAPGQLWALLNAILHSHPSIVAIYEAYLKALERACAMNATLNGGDASLMTKTDHALEFLLHALTRVGQAMDPIEQGTSGAEEDPVVDVDSMEMDSLAKILEAAVVDVLPDSLQNMAYELLMEGDSFLLDTLKSFVEKGNATRLYDDIFFRLRVRLESIEAEEGYRLHKVAASDAASITEAGLGAEANAKVEPTELDPLRSLICGAATLAEHGRISKEAAAAIVANYELRDKSLSLVYDYHEKTGDTLTFIQQLELYAAASDEDSLGLNSGPYNSALSDSVVTLFNDMTKVPIKELTTVTKDDDSVAVEELLHDALEGFSKLQVQALKVAVVKNDPFLDEAIFCCQRTGDSIDFKAQLEKIANKTIQEKKLNMMSS